MAEYIKMAGSATFYSFAYLRKAATNARDAAKENPVGSNYHRVSAVLLSVLAVEAHLNHIGEEKLSFWRYVERLNWKEKLDLIADQLNLEIEYGRRPFQGLKELFTFRNMLAHGRTYTFDAEYVYRQDSDDYGKLDPEWLKKYWADEVVERALEDTWKVMEWLQEKAGLRKEEMHLISDGSFEEVIEVSPKPQSETQNRSGPAIQ